MADDAQDPTSSAEASSAEDVTQNQDAAPEVDPLEQAKQEADRLRDQLLRTAADFDNFRKRAKRDQEEAERRGREELLRDILPVFDNLERATQHAESATDVQSLADGINMVMRQFSDTLAKAGIERVPSVGAPFDPTVHEAIQHLETNDHPPGTIAAEVQGGYRHGERLVRPALVVVAKAPAEPGSEPSPGSSNGSA